MGMIRNAYRLLSYGSTAKAASKGPGALARNYVRRKAHKSLARSLRKMGL